MSLHKTPWEIEGARPDRARKIPVGAAIQPKTDPYHYAPSTAVATPTLLESPPPARPKGRR